MKHFLRVISDCEADILAAADILSFVPQSQYFTKLENLAKGISYGENEVPHLV
jgi:hypothetical protein